MRRNWRGLKSYISTNISIPFIRHLSSHHIEIWEYESSSLCCESFGDLGSSPNISSGKPINHHISATFMRKSLRSPCLTPNLFMNVREGSTLHENENLFHPIYSISLNSSIYSSSLSLSSCDEMKSAPDRWSSIEDCGKQLFVCVEHKERELCGDMSSWFAYK